MYEAHWGLRESPFRSTLDTKYFFPSPTHEEALARLHFLVDHGRRLGLLRGNTGCGKTLVLRVFASQLRRQSDCAVLVNVLGMDAPQFLWTLAEELGAKPLSDDPIHVLWQKITRRLQEHRYQQIRTIFLFDDADEATEPVLQFMHRLLGFEPTVESRMTMLLAMDPNKTKAVGPRLLDLCELRIDLEPWNAGDVTQFLQSSITQAGGNASIFDDMATSRLFELSHGIPRHVSQLAELSLLAAAGEQRPSVDERMVHSVYEELSVS